MIYRWLLVVLSIAATAAYAFAPNARGWSTAPETARILFFHVPPAMLCSLFYLWAAIQGGVHLVKRSPESDHKSSAAVEIGTLLCALATVTGSMFAYIQWGRFWDWDPRQLDIFLQLMVYAAYFALRSSFTDPQRRAVIGAAYAIFAFVTVPFLIWIMPRLVALSKFSQHAQANNVVIGNQLDATYRIYLYSTAFVVLLVACWAYKLRTRQLDLEQQTGDPIANRVSDSHPAVSNSGVVRPIRLRSDRSEADS